jgi:hypothetical protein
MLSNAHVAPICEERRPADVLAAQAGLAPSPAADPPGVGSMAGGIRNGGPDAGSRSTNTGAAGA